LFYGYFTLYYIQRFRGIKYHLRIHLDDLGLKWGFQELIRHIPKMKNQINLKRLTVSVGLFTFFNGNSNYFLRIRVGKKIFFIKGFFLTMQ